VGARRLCIHLLEQAWHTQGWSGGGRILRFSRVQSYCNNVRNEDGGGNKRMID